MKRQIAAVVLVSTGLLMFSACSTKKAATDKSSSISSSSTMKSSQESKIQKSSSQITPKTETIPSPSSSSSSTLKSSPSATTVPSTSQTTNQSSQSSSPYSVMLSPSVVPITFHFKGINVPDSVVINDSNVSSVTVYSKDGTSKTYNATTSTIATKQIRLFSAQNNQVRTIKVNTQITLNTSTPDQLTNSGPLYLFYNSQGGISLATPNYAGNVSDNERDIMLEVIQ